MFNKYAYVLHNKISAVKNQLAMEHDWWSGSNKQKITVHT